MAGALRLVPCTPQGVVELLERTGVELAGREAVVVGRSELVGKPLAALLLARDATVTVCHSRTRDLATVCRRADVLVAAVGRPRMLGARGCHTRQRSASRACQSNRLLDPPPPRRPGGCSVDRYAPGRPSRIHAARSGSVSR